MSVKLETFKKQLTNIVRPNRFLVYVTPPTSMQEGRYNADKLKFWAQSAAIPDRTFNEINIKYFGMDYKIPAGEVTQDLMINFIMDANYNVREFFETWAFLINNRRTSQKGYAQDLFDGNLIEVHQIGFGNEEDVIAKYEYIYAFPKTVDQIELNYETVDSMETFAVTFGYSYWKRTYPI